MPKQNIIPGTQEWEDICIRCGLCCLVKYCDNLGRIFLTNIRCDMLDITNGNCKCYSANVDSRDSGNDSCLKHNGSSLNYETLNGDYIVPGCCAYVQRFGDVKLVKKCAKRPDVDLANTVPESDVPNEDIPKHIIPGSFKYFKYNPPVNKKLHEDMQSKTR